MKRTIILSDPEPAPRLAGEGRVWRAVISLACAGMADGLQWLFPPLWIVADAAMVVALLLIWGRRWEIAVAVLPEVIPGLALFPTWTLFVAYLTLTHRKPAETPPPMPSVPPVTTGPGERPMKRVGPEQ